MKVVEFLKMGREFLKLMSSFDLKRDDYQYIELYEEYARMRCEGEKVDYILNFLSVKHKLSESTIKRVIKRFSKEVR
jgi:hypothetical protein